MCFSLLLNSCSSTSSIIGEKVTDGAIQSFYKNQDSLRETLRSALDGTFVFLQDRILKTADSTLSRAKDTTLVLLDSSLSKFDRLIDKRQQALVKDLYSLKYDLLNRDLIRLTQEMRDTLLGRGTQNLLDARIRESFATVKIESKNLQEILDAQRQGIRNDINWVLITGGLIVGFLILLIAFLFFRSRAVKKELTIANKEILNIQDQELKGALLSNIKEELEAQSSRKKLQALLSRK